MFDKVTLKLNVDPLILGALKEDITSEDVSTNSVMPEPKLGEVELICKQDGIICGLQVFARTFELLDEDVEITFFAKDGDEVKKGQKMAVVRGDIRVLLCGERTALNYLQRMSGIATYTNGVAKLLAGTKTKLLDTRKTSPNNRIFEKYAVRIGGGNNHRYNLTDGVLLKDNHIGAAGGVKQAVTMAKEYAPFVRKIEVEVENLEMVKEAVDAGADIIMLDNMSHEEMKEAVEVINHKAEIEISGNVTKENIAKIIEENMKQKTINHWLKESNISIEEADLLFSYIICGGNAILKKWYDSNFSIDEDKVKKLFDEVIKYGLYDFIYTK